MSNLPLIHTIHGYRIPGTEIYIDPLVPVAHAIISHAHGDHAVEGHENVYCSAGTAALIQNRFRYAARRLHTKEFGEQFTLEGLDFSLHAAGHMLGSSQVRWQRNGESIIYTGDYKRQADASCEPFETVQSDIFITETTFAQPGKQHPSDEEIVTLLRKASEINLMIGAYSLGKAQRLTRLISQQLQDIRIMIHPKIVPYHKVYEAQGFALGTWEPYKREAFKHAPGIIYIVPPPVLLNFRPGKHFLRAFATGWDEKHSRYDFPLPMSDHADWPALIQTILESKARKVYTIHGDGKALMKAEALKQLEILELDA
ncbi:MAG: MBL fold metallo-hydrolase [Bacteroidia bacterium]